jgi:hypothetical protein
MVALVGCIAAGPAITYAQGSADVSGRWSVDGAPHSSDFESPALGTDITIERMGNTITIAYSLNRTRTWTLDGVEHTRKVQVADAGSYNEISSARINGGRIVVVTGRDRDGQIGREERTLYRNGDTLIVEGTRRVNQKVIKTSKLVYHKATASAR